SDGTTADLGSSLVGGGVIGLVLLVAQWLLGEEAAERASAESLRRQLTTSDDFKGIDLDGAVLPDLYAPDRVLLAASLRDADLTRARLFFSDMRHVDARGAMLLRADLRGVNLAEARLEGADLRGADLTDASLRGACLQGAKLAGAVLDQVGLERADLRAPDLAAAELGAVMWDETTLWPDGFEPPPSVSLSWGFLESGKPSFERYLEDRRAEL
ncbi:hypothetical protein B7486_54880, partial [cyanobacterium TDX16]